jgi:hypothetical protein
LRSFSSSPAAFLGLPEALGGAAAALAAFSASFWRCFWRFFSSVLDTRSPVTSSRWRFATSSVGGAGAVESAMVIVFVSAVAGKS